MLAFILTAVLASMQAATVPQTARIAGQVVDDATGKPIAGARVMLMGTGRPGGVAGPPPGAITDDEGRFAFEGLAAGGYNLQVSKAGFAPAPKNALMANIGVGPGETKNDLRLALERGGAIAGRVVDAAGNPLAEVRVIPMRPTTTGQSAMLMPVGQNVQTNDLGEFRAYGLPAGEYYVQVTERPDFPMNGSGQRTTVLAPTYFPASRDASGAQAVSVTAGQTASIVVQMATARVFRVSGAVVDDAGTPVANAVVTLNSDRGGAGMPFSPPSRLQTDAAGRFQFTNVMAGTYRIVAAIPISTSGSPNTAGGGGSFGTYSTTVGSAGIAGFGVSGGVNGVSTMTETRNGVTTQYQVQNDNAALATVADADVTGVRVVIRPVRLQ